MTKRSFEDLEYLEEHNITLLGKRNYIELDEIDNKNKNKQNIINDNKRKFQYSNETFINIKKNKLRETKYDYLKEFPFYWI